MEDGLRERSANEGLAWICVVWVLFFVPLVSYVVVANLIGVEGSLTGGVALDVLNLAKYMLYGVTVLLLVLIFLLRRAFRKKDSIIHQLARSWSAVARQILLVILVGVLCQAIGIYGLTCFIVDGDFVSLYVLVGIAAAMLALLHPRGQDLTPTDRRGSSRPLASPPRAE